MLTRTGLRVSFCSQNNGVYCLLSTQTVPTKQLIKRATLTCRTVRSQPVTIVLRAVYSSLTYTVITQQYNKYYSRESCVTMAKRVNRSDVWDHFDKLLKSNVRCNICKKDLAVSGGVTTGMHAHLRSKHPAIMEPSSAKAEASPKIAKFVTQRSCPYSKKLEVSQQRYRTTRLLLMQKNHQQSANETNLVVGSTFC